MKVNNNDNSVINTNTDTNTDFARNIYNTIMQSAQNINCVFQKEKTTSENQISSKNTEVNVSGFYLEKSDSNDEISETNNIYSKPLLQDVLDEEILKCDSLKTLSKNVNIKNMKTKTKEALLATLKWAEANNYDIRITSGYRDASKQKLIYKKTPNVADSPDHSMHCKGLAFDIGIYPKGSNQKNRNPKLYLQLAKYLRNKGFDIFNGREFPDSPKDGTEWWHFQVGKNDGYLFARSNRKKH